jgi:hypothetical protein
MPTRRKLDLEKVRASLNTFCPHCTASIPPEDQNRVDSEQHEMPRSAERVRAGVGETSKALNTMKPRRLRHARYLRAIQRG